MKPHNLLSDFAEEDVLAAELNKHPRTIKRWSDQAEAFLT